MTGTETQPMLIRPVTTNIILYCQKWAPVVDFYRNLLQLPVLFATDWFVEFALNPVSRLSVADEKRSSIKSCAGRGVTLSLEVEDIDKTWGYLNKAGLCPTIIREHPWNARVFYFFDPEGHRLEIWQNKA